MTQLMQQKSIIITCILIVIAKTTCFMYLLSIVIILHKISQKEWYNCISVRFGTVH